jgi:methyl-accepting chemotaxis protein
MLKSAESSQQPAHPAVVGYRADGPGDDAALSRYLPQLAKMSEQLRQTSKQIEDSVLGVCGSFQGIAARARATVERASGFLGQDSSSGKPSFEGLIQTCGDTLITVMNATTEAGEVARRAIERIEQIDRASQQITGVLGQLDAIAMSNRMLALNARLEAAHAGKEGAGFGVVAVELAAQTVKSRQVTAQVSELALSLRSLAESTLEDLRRMSERDQERIEQSRQEVDEALRNMQVAHAEMAAMLNGMTQEGSALASEIGSAVRGMQFQDRIAQRLAHVIEDLETLQGRLSGRLPESDDPAHGFSAYTMHEERVVAGNAEGESAGGDVELF